MRFSELKTPLFESARGLAARKPGDPFTTENGDTMYFEEIAFYPNSGSYEEDDLIDAINAAEHEYGEVAKPTK